MSSDETKETPEQDTMSDAHSQCCGGHHSGEEGHKCCRNHGSAPEEKKGEHPKFDFDDMPDFPLPAPNLIALATTLAQQAMVSMGIIPNPMTGKPAFMFNQAKHLIDTIALVFDKTEGNRTDEETKALDSIIHELRMMFVAAQNEKAKRDAAKEN